MKRVLKISGIVFLAILLILILFPFLFKGRIQQELKNLANSSLKCELNFSDMSLSFFRHFPNLTFTLKDLMVKGSHPFESDTLISAGEISFGINVASLFGKTVQVTRVYFDHANVNILFNEKGVPNYDIYKSSDTVSSGDTSGSGGVNLRIEHIYLKDCRIMYADPTIPAKIIAWGFNYRGGSHLSEDIFNLTSDVRIDSLNLFYDNKDWLGSKPVKALLTTKINTKNFSVNFVKNEIMVKDIPMKFQGRFDFEKEGYNLFIHFSSVMGKEYLTATFKLRQVEFPWIFVKTDARIDLDRWTKAFGLEIAEARGWYELHLKAEGPYIMRPDTTRIRKDTIIKSIPNFDVKSTLTGGYIKYKALPEAVSNLDFNLEASCERNDYRTISIHMEKLKFVILKNEISGYCRFHNLDEPEIDASITATCNLSELKKALPMDSIDLSGLIDLNLKIKGRFAPEKKMFPVADATIRLKDGSVRTKYYPHPLEKIELLAEVNDQTGDLKGLNIRIKPLSFDFEGKNFTLNASMKNFEDLVYEANANGIIDVARIYKVFSRKGTDLNGYIEAAVSLKGRQSDAAAGRYERLHNSGTLKLRDISLSSELFPKPFIIRQGGFRFDQDKVWFDTFLCNYGNSDLRLNGAVSNILNYALSKGETLKGDFKLTSDFIDADEFTAYASPDTASVDSSAQETGVIIIPSGLDMDFEASAREVSFQGLKIKDLNGELDMKKGILALKNTGFILIGCKVSIDATYGSITPEKAFFDFAIKAEDFDIKKAYNEVALFRDLVSSAEKAEGIISMDYALKGRLNAEMYPIMPSLTGGGTISVKKVKVYGLKLFNDIGKSTQKEGISNPDISKVDIKSTIKNNTITIEQFRFKVSGIRLRISGSTTFDSRVNLKIRLGLPPLGLFGIPLKVTGPMDNLKIRYGKGGTGDGVAETEYSDELPPEMLERIKAAKEDTDEGEEQK